MESNSFRRFYPKIKLSIYPALCQSPYFGNNIKRLKGELSAIFRYRIGDYRIFYTIDPEKKIVFILSIHHRKDAYKK
jgi:mRNA interferase RelE/StbE